MYTGILRLIIIVWVMVAPLNVTPIGSIGVVGAVAVPIKAFLVRTIRGVKKSSVGIAWCLLLAVLADNEV